MMKIIGGFMYTLALAGRLKGQEMWPQDPTIFFNV